MYLPVLRSRSCVSLLDTSRRETRAKSVPLPFILGIILLAVPAAAATFTAGPAGTFPTIQAAVDAALVAGGTNEVRVQAGEYVERISVPNSLAAGSLSITGGWDAAFSVRSSDETLTTIDGDAAGTTVTLKPAGGELVLEGFTIRNGSMGGILLEPTNAIVRILDNRIVNNVNSDYGGGLSVTLGGTSQFFLQNNRIADNASISVDSPAAGGGISFGARDSSTFTISGNVVENNLVESASNQTTGGGIYASTYNDVSGSIRDNLFEGNRFEGGSAAAVGPAAAIWQGVGSTGTITLRRNRWIGNENNKTVGRLQVNVIANGTGTVRFTDSVVGGSITCGGLDASARDAGILRITNVTVANNAGGLGLSVFGPGTKSLYNTIVYGNGSATSLIDVTTGNLLTTNPNFVDAAGDDYRIAAPSAALDAGDNAPPGGLGPSDVDGNTRIVNGVVDIGAYEHAVGAIVTFDPNDDGSVSVADIFFLINHLFAGGPAPIGNGDANGDMTVSVADIFYIINHLFAGGPAPA